MRIDCSYARGIVRRNTKAGLIVEAGFAVWKDGDRRGVGVIERQHDVAPTGEILQHGGVLQAHPDQAVREDKDREWLLAVQDRRTIAGRDSE